MVSGFLGGMGGGLQLVIRPVSGANFITSVPSGKVRAPSDSSQISETPRQMVLASIGEDEVMRFSVVGEVCWCLVCGGVSGGPPWSDFRESGN